MIDMPVKLESESSGGDENENQEEVSLLKEKQVESRFATTPL